MLKRLMRGLLALCCASSAMPAMADSNVMQAAFQPGYEGLLAFPDKNNQPLVVAVRVLEVGKLKLPSGRLVGLDPFGPDVGSRPFDVTTPPGEYRVRAVVALLPPERFWGGNPNTPTAFVRVDITDEPAVRWEVAQLQGPLPEDTPADEPPHYYTSTATGGFAA